MLMIPDPIEYAGKVHAELVRLSSKDLNQQNKRSRLSVDSDHRITPINLAAEYNLPFDNWAESVLPKVSSEGVFRTENSCREPNDFTYCSFRAIFK